MDGSGGVEEDDQINITDQGLSPSDERAGQYPSLGRTLPFGEQSYALLGRALDAERRVGLHPVEVIDIYMRGAEPL